MLDKLAKRFGIAGEEIEAALIPLNPTARLSFAKPAENRVFCERGQLVPIIGGGNARQAVLAISPHPWVRKPTSPSRVYITPRAQACGRSEWNT